jgi:hypothetical protein
MVHVKKKTKRDTMDVVSEMMMIPMNQLPQIAMEHLKYISSKIGFCGETCVTSYAAYCQAILKLPCKNKSYTIDEDSKEWFSSNRTKYRLK